MERTIKGIVEAGNRILHTFITAALEDLFARKQPEEIIIVFCRYPEPGNTMTRLVPALGTKGAADYHRLLTELTMDKARDLFGDYPRRAVEVHYTGGNAKLMSDWLGSDLVYIEQSPGDLGLRMNSALDHAFRAGARRVLIIGTDVPDLSIALLEEALLELRSHELVLGPSRDGGYYLIGLNRPLAGLFQGVEWGTHTVMQDTLRLAREHGLSYTLTKPLTDIDRPEDLILHGGRSIRMSDSSSTGTARSLKGSISVIIPTLNEESNIVCVR